MRSHLPVHRFRPVAWSTCLPFTVALVVLVLTPTSLTSGVHLPGNSRMPPPTELPVPSAVAGPRTASTLRTASPQDSPICGSPGRSGGTCTAAVPSLGPAAPDGWTNISQSARPAPTCRSGNSLAGDGTDGYVLDFGGEYGCDASSNPLSGTAVADTWTFENGSWTNLTGSLSSSPAARFWASMAWDPVDQRVILFGGCSACSSDFADTWNWSRGAWHLESASSAPPARSRAAMAYDSTDQEIVLFGGYNHTTGAALSDTWTYSGGKWHALTVSGSSPSPRFASVLVDDPAAHGVLLFGGQDGLSAPFNDTWLFSGTSWTRISAPVAPSPGWDSAAAYDASAQGVVLFGSCTSGGCATSSNTTWLFRNGSWNDLDSRLPRLPPERGSFGLAPVPNASVLLLFGGIGPSATSASGSTRFNDTWEFRTPLFVNGTSYPIREDLGQSLVLNVSSFGGTTPLTANWTGLPSGCPVGPVLLPLVCTPNVTGSFSAWANVSDPTGSTARAGPWTLDIYPRPIARPFASPSSGTAPLNVSLSANVSGGIPPFNLTWKLGSSTLGSGAVLLHTFSVAGTYLVNLTGMDATGSTVSAAVQVVVRAAVLPLVPSYSVATGIPFCLSGSPFVNLSLSGSAAGGTAPYAFLWTLLGTGYAGSQVNVTVGTNATFPIFLVVNDSGGQSVRREMNGSTPDFACLSALAVTTLAAPFCQSGSGWDNLTVTARATGGTGPYSYAWLVGSEAFSGSSATIIVPAGARVPVSLDVTDSLGRHTEATADPASASVTCGGLGPENGGSAFPLSSIEIAILILALVAALLVGWRVVRRRSAAPPAGDPVPAGALSSAAPVPRGPSTPNAPDGATPSAVAAPREGRGLSAAALGGSGPPVAAPRSSSLPPPDPTRAPLATADLILLHLSRQPMPRSDDLAPLELTQEGIEQGIGRPQSSFARVLQRLEANGSVRSETRHVRGATRRKKVYLLTPIGQKLARELRTDQRAPGRGDDGGAP